MGSCFSSSPPSSFDYVRVVHISGYVEDFIPPVTVGKITGKPAKHLLCSSSELFSFGCAIPRIPPETLLQPGKLYFMLPHAIFQSDTTTTDIVALVTRLTAVARGCKAKPMRPACREDGPVGGGSNSLKLMFASRKRKWLPGLSFVVERRIERCDGFNESTACTGAITDANKPNKLKIC